MVSAAPALQAWKGHEIADCDPSKGRAGIPFKADSYLVPPQGHYLESVIKSGKMETDGFSVGAWIRLDKLALIQTILATSPTTDGPCNGKSNQLFFGGLDGKLTFMVLWPEGNTCAHAMVQSTGRLPTDKWFFVSARYQPRQSLVLALDDEKQAVPLPITAQISPLSKGDIYVGGYPSKSPREGEWSGLRGDIGYLSVMETGRPEGNWEREALAAKPTSTVRSVVAETKNSKLITSEPRPSGRGADLTINHLASPTISPLSASPANTDGNITAEHDITINSDTPFNKKFGRWHVIVRNPILDIENPYRKTADDISYSILHDGSPFVIENNMKIHASFGPNWCGHQFIEYNGKKYYLNAGQTRCGFHRSETDQNIVSALERGEKVLLNDGKGRITEISGDGLREAHIAAEEVQRYVRHHMTASANPANTQIKEPVWISKTGPACEPFRNMSLQEYKEKPVKNLISSCANLDEIFSVIEARSGFDDSAFAKFRKLFDETTFSKRCQARIRDRLSGTIEDKGVSEKVFGETQRVVAIVSYSLLRAMHQAGGAYKPVKLKALAAESAHFSEGDLDVEFAQNGSLSSLSWRGQNPCQTVAGRIVSLTAIPNVSATVILEEMKNIEKNARTKIDSAP